MKIKILLLMVFVISLNSALNIVQTFIKMEKQKKVALITKDPYEALGAVVVSEISKLPEGIKGTNNTRSLESLIGEAESHPDNWKKYSGKHKKASKYDALFDPPGVKGEVVHLLRIKHPNFDIDAAIKDGHSFDSIIKFLDTTFNPAIK